MADIYLNAEEVAARYKISIRTLERWRYTGAGGPKWVRLGFRRVGYRLSDLEEWAQAATFTSRAHELSLKAAG